MATKRKFRDEWLQQVEFQPWLTSVQADPTKASCTTCHIDFNANLTTIKRHKGTQSHQKSEESRKEREELLQNIVPQSSSNQEITFGVKFATILMLRHSVMKEKGRQSVK
ncbi:hypothetical protein Pcinc_015368 [Petrolisthes cinctipes]|uniref:Uncharacterized protein n=1 Tax=Petrolisthes cinctipes TaxID=88211 RepID=A0AAE1FUZ8_PETCI|nr:hypothetical protein Pcinc_015368 [Petrolisthes cinctipes]